MDKRKSGRSGILGLHKRIPLTLKMIFVAVITGICIWFVFDIVHTYKLKSIFQVRLSEKLNKQAIEDRTDFDRYVRAHLDSISLLIKQKNFSEYIEKQTWSEDKSSELKVYGHFPEWFPESSAPRSLVQPRFAMLLDSEGRVREIYNNLHNDQIPELSLNSTQALMLKSRGKIFMTAIEGVPYIVASEPYIDSSGKVKGVLMFASPVDEIFFATALGNSVSGHIVALLKSGKEASVLVSSNPAEIPAGAELNKLTERYMVKEQDFFDYSASEQHVKLVTFGSLEEIGSLVTLIASSERQLRFWGLPLLVGSFTLLMFWITRRIHLLTERISDFSESTLGVSPRILQKGDELIRLEESFQYLTEEVLAARDIIKREAEEIILLEKKNLEVIQKEKELMLLQSVTQAVGVGVIRKTSEGLKAVNLQMEEFAETCGGLSNFDIGNVEDVDCTILDKNGNNRIFNIRNPDGFKEEEILLVRDITTFKEQTDALQHMAMHDSLTGLPNRALFSDRLQQAIFIGKRENKTIALLMMDLDRFKEINDTLGHHIGDFVLTKVAERLPRLLRKSDTFARLGGDEFAVVLPATDMEQAKETAGKLIKALDEPFVIEGHNLYVGASVGIVLSPDHGDDASTLLQRVDVAMYVAKNNQSGFSIYHPDHDRHSLQNLILMGELRNAIENDDLSLYYQPKINYETGKIDGLEALVRWHHPQQGLIPPDEFIFIAEYTGLIRPLTMWVLNRALRQYVEWRHAGIQMEIVMSVNVSVRNLLDAQFPQEVASRLKAWNIDPACLELEITESAVMADPDYAMKILMQLDMVGVRLSIDDFGTGYSSLAYLKKLPVDEIKIDKSFVKNMSDDESDAVIVRSTIDLAHNLGLSVIAEGVETKDTLDTLRELGCDGAQGYYICRPLPPTELIKWASASEWMFERRNRRVYSS